MNILVIGHNGQLGSDLVGEAARRGHRVRGLDYPDIDITRRDATIKCIVKESPACVINAAAYTAVDLCESNEPEAFAVNADGAGNVAAAAATLGVPCIHFSTDYVFDGLKNGPYVETDAPNPQSVYGKSKLAGERHVAAACPKHLICRTAWLYGIRGNNFVKAIRANAINKAAAGEPLLVVSDQHGTPTWSGDLSRQVLALLDCTDYGIYHCTSEGACSWYDFAGLIVEEAGIDVRIVACTTDQFPRPARRPANSVLENQRLKDHGANIMPEWRRGFEEFLIEERRQRGS